MLEFRRRRRFVVDGFFLFFPSEAEVVRVAHGRLDGVAVLPVLVLHVGTLRKAQLVADVAADRGDTAPPR